METRSFTAFAGHRRIASGIIDDVLRKIHGEPDVLVFEDATGNQVDFDLRGTPDDAIARLVAHPMFAEERAPRGRGRPKLGVVSREVTLLPRHWEWLEGQRGGISVALRSLVEEARKRDQSKYLARRARDAAGKFMWTVAGNLPRFEEASRALYSGDDAKLRAQMRGWPKDVREHVLRMLDPEEDSQEERKDGRRDL